MSSKTDAKKINVIDILGGRKTLGSEVRKEDDLIERIRQGLPYETVESLVAATAISPPLLPRLLGVTERTLQRRQTQKVLKKAESDRLVRLAKLFERTAKVLGDSEEAKAWLHHPNITLGNKTPIEMMDDPISEERVYAVLGRIEHGVYS
jgi:putative toxin-antitoxin system antitoxin component (TIGR02293 family)